MCVEFWSLGGVLIRRRQRKEKGIVGTEREEGGLEGKGGGGVLWIERYDRTEGLVGRRHREK